MTPTPRRTILVPSHRYRRLQFGLGNYASGGASSAATIYADQAYFANYRRGPMQALGLSVGQFNVRCPFSHSLPDDPIVFPAQPGASHLHEFFGSDVTNASSDTTSMQAGSTTCERIADKAGYWAPALYKDGVRVPPQHMLVYYRGGHKPMPIQTIPTGLRMIAGNKNATGPQPVSFVNYACNSSPPYAPGVSGVYSTPPTAAQCAVGPGGTFRNGFEIRITFPDCWDGALLDSVNHQSHMAYPVGNATTGQFCPASHPIPLPQIQIKIGYEVFAPGILLAQNPGGSFMQPYQIHSDFWNAWDATELQRLITTCLNANKDCGGSG